MKHLLLPLLMFIPMCVSAEEQFEGNSKKLLSITKQSDRYSEVGRMEYDEYGRISTFTVTDRDGKETTYTYTYNGDEIEIGGIYDSFTVSIADGRIASEHGRLEKDNVDLDITYTYDGDGQICQTYQEATRNGNAFSRKTSIFTWSDGNLASRDYYSKDDLSVHTDYSYTSLTSEPVMHAIFGFGEGEGIYLDEIAELLATYPYLGTLPKNLFQHNEVIDYFDDNRQYTYDYSYETNATGDIVMVTFTTSSSTYTYLLEWEDAPSDPSFTISDFIYTLLDGNTVSVAAANTSLSGDVMIPSMVKHNGQMFTVVALTENGFADCTGMTSIMLPNTISAIGHRGFANCTSLQRITLKMKEPISDVYADSFEGVDKQQCLLDVPQGSGTLYRTAPVWCDFWKVAAEDETVVDGITYKVNDDGTVTIVSANHSAGGKYVIPSSVVIDGVEHEVSAIGENAFNGCTDMTSVTIPSTITTIGSGAFAGCENLMEVFCLSSEPIDLSSAFARAMVFANAGQSVFPFQGVDLENCILYVPIGTLEQYRNAPGWSLFKHIVEVNNDGIYTVSTDKGSAGDVYDLGGRMVRQKNGADHQHRGYYIIGGQKKIVK